MTHSCSLQVLDLSSNNLASAIPGTWSADGAFPALRELRLDSNQLTGPLPPGWTNLTMLEVATLQNNNFVGEEFSTLLQSV